MKPPDAVRLRSRIIGCAEPLRQCAQHHRHLPRAAGALVGVEVVGPDGWPVAWGLVGRPSSRILAGDGWVELTRSIVPDGAPPSCASVVLGAAARWAKAKGSPIVTYTLAHEAGVSLRAAGWVEVSAAQRVRQWGCASRPRAVRADVIAAPKRRWVAAWCLPVALARGWEVTA